MAPEFRTSAHRLSGTRHDYPSPSNLTRNARRLAIWTILVTAVALVLLILVYPVSFTERVTGTVVYYPGQSLVVSSTSGILELDEISDGSRVSALQSLGRIHRTSDDFSRRNLQAARSQLTSQLLEVAARTKEHRRGARQTAIGSLNFERESIRTAIGHAQVRVKEFESKQLLQQKELERVQALFAQGYATRRDAETAEISLASTKSDTALASSGLAELEGKLATIERAAGEVAAASSSQDLADRRMTLQEQREQAADMESRIASITAGTSGVVENLERTSGEFINQGDIIARIRSDGAVLEVRAYIPRRAMDGRTVGEIVSGELVGRPYSTGRSRVTGRISYISPIQSTACANCLTTGYRVRLSVKSSEAGLHYGDGVELKFQTPPISLLNIIVDAFT